MPAYEHERIAVRRAGYIWQADVRIYEARELVQRLEDVYEAQELVLPGLGVMTADVRNGFAENSTHIALLEFDSERSCVVSSFYVDKRGLERLTY